MRALSIRPMVFDDIPILAGWMATIPLWQRYGLTVETVRAMRSIRGCVESAERATRLRRVKAI